MRATIFLDYFSQLQMLDMIVLLFSYIKILELVLLTQLLKSVSFENSSIYTIGSSLQHKEVVS